MYSYEIINDAVNSVYFCEGNDNCPVYLDLEETEKFELATRIGCVEHDLENHLASAVFDALVWSKLNIYSWHTRRLNDWLQLGCIKAPPFSALLLAFSVAAENMRQSEGLSKQNYYGRLTEFLCCEEEISKVSAAGKYTEIFWQSLNQWLLSNDLNYGIPTAKQI
ncbi:hypothetical protein N9L91_04525, partial [Pseudomonadales bacterium]|nr:hypothetical protein [Pseudomonadales bacterium]